MGHKKALEEVLAKPFFYNIVYITNPDDINPIQKEVVSNSKSAIVVKFFDFDFEEDEHGPAGPSESQVKDILDYAIDKEDVICCCMMGISRSSASAYSILCSKGEAKEALSVLEHGKHRPNILVAEHAAKILSKPELLTEIQQWIEDGKK